MQRREFLAASAAAAFGLATANASRAAAPAPAAGTRQILELRTYHFASAEKLAAFDAFLKDGMIPALNRAGVQPVGAFRLFAKDNAALKLEADPNELYVLLPHASADSALSLENRLARDEAFIKSAGPVIGAPKNDPAYTRFEAQLMVAFDDCPTVIVPTKAQTRLFQLRIYESHNQERALRKIAMFNPEGGEIAIFRRTGLNPVFFGQTIAGGKMPNLTYMVGFENEEAQKKAWDTFRADPDWKRISKDDKYKDTVSTITNLVLRPTAASQI